MRILKKLKKLKYQTHYSLFKMDIKIKNLFILAILITLITVIYFFLNKQLITGYTIYPGGAIINNQEPISDWAPSGSFSENQFFNTIGFNNNEYFFTYDDNNIKMTYLLDINEDEILKAIKLNITYNNLNYKFIIFTGGLQLLLNNCR